VVTGPSTGSHHHTPTHSALVVAGIPHQGLTPALQMQHAGLADPHSRVRAARRPHDALQTPRRHACCTAGGTAAAARPLGSGDHGAFTRLPCRTHSDRWGRRNSMHTGTV
jgi:hypothetical protein